MFCAALTLSAVGSFGTCVLQPEYLVVNDSETLEPPRSRETSSESVPVDAIRLSGEIRMDQFFVPQGEVVYVEGDLRILCRTSIIIDGDVRCVDVDGANEARDAPALELVSEGLIYIAGRIDGGDGYTGVSPGVPGGGWVNDNSELARELYPGVHHGWGWGKRWPWSNWGRGRRSSRLRLVPD